MIAVFRARGRDAIWAKVEGFVGDVAAGRAGKIDFPPKAGRGG